MKLKAVLGIKSANGAKLIKYRIIDEQKNTRDVPIPKIKEVLQKGVIIAGLKLNNNEIVETTEIPKISEVGNRISLYDWCLQNGERGQRILKEFIAGDNKFTTPRSRADAEAQGKDVLETYLAALLGETGSVTQRRFSTAVEGDTLVVTLSAECEEQIGKEVPIAVSEG